MCQKPKTNGPGSDQTACPAPKKDPPREQRWGVCPQCHQECYLATHVCLVPSDQTRREGNGQ